MKLSIMAKASANEATTRIPTTFGSRIPIPGKHRFTSPRNTCDMNNVGRNRSNKTVRHRRRPEDEEDDDMLGYEDDVLKIGDSVQIDGRIGLIRYIGEVCFENGVWCGIELDRPIGKHDGCINGIRYFTCGMHCGIMAPRDKVHKSTIAAKENVTLTPLALTPKQNSFELDDSLGILTPDQMEVPTFVDLTKTPSSEDMKSLFGHSDQTISNSRTPSPHPSRPDTIDLDLPHNQTRSGRTEHLSPAGMDNSAVEYSLGLIDDDMLSNNLLSANQFKIDQTPSPDEELPLDLKPTTVQTQTVALKTEPEPIPKCPVPIPIPNKVNSLITSITSITSLDTGYQGDGEMSRPASRGADHSPNKLKPTQQQQLQLQQLQQPWQRIIRRPIDPMTDSDFFTESDADGHEENVTRGDRHAQVIDGTLYGTNGNEAAGPIAEDAAAAAAILVSNNRQEEMDSSGIFTDLDTNPRTDDLSDYERNRIYALSETSPSEASMKTISENVQQIRELPPENRSEHTENSPQPNKKSPRTRTPLPKEESPNKKLKMPRRNIANSKVKNENEVEMKIKTKQTQDARKSVKKSVNRWDAVMMKISKGQDENTSKSRLRDVKSKVSTGLGASSGSGSGAVSIKRYENDKCPSTGSDDGRINSKPKIRRVRVRSDFSSTSVSPSLTLPKGNKLIRAGTTSSIHSSVSDLSVSTSLHVSPKQTNVKRAAKKRDSGAIVNETLTIGGLTTPSVHSSSPPSSSSRSPARITRQSKKNTTAFPLEGSNRRTVSRRMNSTCTSNGLKSSSATSHTVKDPNRVNGGVSAAPRKGASPVRNSNPVVLLQESTPAVPSAAVVNFADHLKYCSKGVEALSVLIQYLVFNLEAFRTPVLKRELEDVKSDWIRDKLELQEIRMGYHRLEDTISEQKIHATHVLEQESMRYRLEIAQLYEKHATEINELKENHTQELLALHNEKSELQCQLDRELSNREREISARVEALVSEKSRKLELANVKLKQEHSIAIDILREENDSIREQLDERTSLIDDINYLRLRNEKLKKEFHDKDKILDEKLIAADDEIAVLKEENKKILETFKSDTKDNKLQAALGRCTQLQDEVDSLRTVFDLKVAELSDLRRLHGEISQAAEELPQALLRAQCLQARVEDLETQLERKTDIEIQLTKESKRLQESWNHEMKQRNRLQLYNEELQWKLKQKSEVVNAILQTPGRRALHDSSHSLCETDDSSPYATPCGGQLNRSAHTASYNEKHHHHHHYSNLERTLSFREATRRGNDTRSNERLHNFEPDNSPPSSPKVKAIVEKSDSVSWVLDMDESPEVLASRMVKRAGSFRQMPTVSVTSAATQTKTLVTSTNPTIRSKGNKLCLSASTSAILENKLIPSLRDRDRDRDRSHLSQSPEDNYLSASWHHNLRTSTPNKLTTEEQRQQMNGTGEASSLPSLPSATDLLLLQSSFPKMAAGEAMISESNSEDDDECSSSTSENSGGTASDDTDTSDESKSEAIQNKHSKMQYDLFLLTESATNSEAMDCSWSED